MGYRSKSIMFPRVAISLAALFLAVSVAFAPIALGTLSTGDLAIVGFNTDNNQLAIVALAAISSGETVKITDRGWDGPSSASDFNNTNTFVEGLITWTTPAMSAGDIVLISITAASTVSASITGGGSAGTVVVTNGYTSFSFPDLHAWGAGGDSIIIYQGTAPSSSLIFIFCVQWNYRLWRLTTRST